MIEQIRDLEDQVQVWKERALKERAERSKRVPITIRQSMYEGDKQKKLDENQREREREKEKEKEREKENEREKEKEKEKEKETNENDDDRKEKNKVNKHVEEAVEESLENVDFKIIEEEDRWIEDEE